MSDDDRVADLLVQWEAAKHSGRLLTPEELCADWPEGLKELRRLIGLLQVADRLLDVGECPETPADAGNDATRDQPLAVPEYEILDKLGQGGMGVVYKARHSVLQRDVALKVLRPGRSASSHHVRRFVREAQALARLQHENIVPIYEARFHDGEFYFAMEFVRGGSLADRREQYSKDPRAAAELIAKVARAVHHAHEQGILHRDLKPGNILLDDAGKPMVADFGLAHLLGAEGGAARAEETSESTAEIPGHPETVSEPLTAAGTQPGTPPYMAPEQFEPDWGPVSERTDVWALGVVLYELLLGRRPFGGEDLVAIRRSVCEGDPVPPHRLRPNLDRVLEAIVLKCLRKAPAERYVSAAKLASELEKWRKGDSVEVLPHGWRRRVARWVVRHPAATTAGLLLGVFALAIPFLIPPAPLPPEDPEERAEKAYRRDLEALEQKLADGQPITLVDPTSRKLIHRRRFGEARVLSPPAEDGEGSVSVVARSISFIELFPAPARDSYRIRIRMRQNDFFSALGNVGVYFAHEAQPADLEAHHFFVRFSFADVGPRATLYKQGEQKGSEAQLSLAYVGPSAERGYDTVFSQYGKLFFVPEAPNRLPGKWQDLTVEVTPQWVEARWGKNKEKVGHIQASVVKTWFEDIRKLFPKLQELQPRERFQGAFGLIVENASLSVERLSVEPSDGSGS